MLFLDPVGSVWIHNKSRNRYIIEGIFNTGRSLDSRHVISVTYRGDNGRHWCKNLKDFLQTMTVPSTYQGLPFTYEEREALYALCLLRLFSNPDTLLEAIEDSIQVIWKNMYPSTPEVNHKLFLKTTRCDSQSIAFSIIGLNTPLGENISWTVFRDTRKVTDTTTGEEVLFGL